MFRFFETLVDPYSDYEQTDTPPRRLWPFLWGYARSFRGVFVVAALFKMAVAGFEVFLLWYVGRVVDVLNSGAPAEVWRLYGTEIIVVALIVLIVRPLISGTDVALLHNTILPNFGTLIRWRSHRHVLRQPVGWFENDFAGRIANRIMQTPPAAGEAVYQVIDAMAYAVVIVLGALMMLSDADPRLAVPMLVWIALYGALLRWTIRHAGPAATASSDARSAITGRVVDSYSNIHSVKMFAHHDREVALCRRGNRNRADAVLCGNAHHHQDGCDADGAERRADRVGDRHGAGALVSRGRRRWVRWRLRRRWCCG